MSNKKRKKETVRLIDVMIQHTDKGPSGFWTDDHEGCGNPKIFPEFNDGLKHGTYVYKDHSLCPWDKDVLYGSEHEHIKTGCYHRCCMKDAKFLTPDLLTTVLTRFKDRLISGSYDDTKKISPLLTDDECSYIEQQKAIESRQQELRWQKEQEHRLKKAAALIRKYRNNEYVKDLLAYHYGSNTVVLTSLGTLDFSPDGMANIVGGEKLTYDDYIDIQIQSFGKYRSSFQMCYYNMPGEFKGCIERKTKKNICFKRIYVSGLFPDGDGFEGKEDHVWMDIHGFEKFEAGDCVSFSAEVYRYIKTSNGKLLDYALRNPYDIKKISSYRLPSNEELGEQYINRIICETCYLSDHCTKMHCTRDQKELEFRKEQMRNLSKPPMSGIN